MLGHTTTESAHGNTGNTAATSNISAFFAGASIHSINSDTQHGGNKIELVFTIHKQFCMPAPVTSLLKHVY